MSRRIYALSVASLGIGVLDAKQSRKIPTQHGDGDGSDDEPNKEGVSSISMAVMNMEVK